MQASEAEQEEMRRRVEKEHERVEKMKQWLRAKDVRMEQERRKALDVGLGQVPASPSCAEDNATTLPSERATVSMRGARSLYVWRDLCRTQLHT